MPPAPPSLKGRALRLLSMREYSRLELERRLQPFEEEPGALARVLDELEAKGFISAQRVLESVLHRKSAKLGVLRLRQELQSKGLPAEAVQEAVGQLHATEVERARAIWRKKFGTAPTNPAERAKQMRFLAGRGFSSDTIQRVVSGADDGDCADI
ncbi:MAG: recombination regulator RecX [Rhodoferax sp.]|nr:recombination regulator RecX [Rhodoferax sp.]